MLKEHFTFSPEQSEFVIGIFSGPIHSTHIKTMLKMVKVSPVTCELLFSELIPNISTTDPDSSFFLVEDACYPQRLRFPFIVLRRHPRRRRRF